MSKKPFIHFKDSELGSLAIKLSSDRRALLDFVRTCSAEKGSNGSYLHSREAIQEKALKLLEDLEEDQ